MDGLGLLLDRTQKSLAKFESSWCFRQRKEMSLLHREASLSIMEQAKSYLALIPKDEWKMTEE